MLEQTQSALADEIRASQQQIEPHRVTLETEYLRTCGKFYGNNAQNDEVDDDPENQRQAVLRQILSETCQGTPQCTIEPRGLEWSEGRSLVLEQACNQLADQLRLREFAQTTAVDFCFRSARAYIGLDRKYGRPCVEALDFDEFLRDSTATSMAKARWTAHRMAPDIDDLIEESKAKGSPWNREFLERVRESMQRDPKGDEKAPSFVERRQFPYWVMHERGPSDEKGNNGTLHYVMDPSVSLAGEARSVTDASLLRKSEKWFGPERGPHCFSAGFKIGHLPVELAPLVANAVQGGFLNEIARAIKEAVVSQKSLGLVQGESNKSLIAAAANGSLITLPHGAQISNLFGQLQIGGMTPEMLAAFQFFMESAQRASGGMFSNLGDVESDATATAINSAAAGYAATMGLYTTNYMDFLRQVFEGFAYWFDLSPKIETQVGPIPPEMAAQMGVRGPFLKVRGGGGGKAEDHRNIALSIDAFSLRSKNEMTMAQDMLAVTGALQFLASLGPWAQALDIDAYMRQVARSRGIRWAEKLVDSGIAYQIGAAMMAQPQAATPTPTGGPKTQLVAPSGSKPAGGYGESKAKPPAQSKAPGKKVA